MATSKESGTGHNGTRKRYRNGVKNPQEGDQEVRKPRIGEARSKQKSVEVARDRDARSVSSTDRGPTDISEERTNNKAYFERSEEESTDLPPGNKAMADNQMSR